MRKLVLALSASAMVGAAAVTMGTGAGSADPSANSTFNVVGEIYAKAVAILRAQGVPVSFGGSVGSAFPQAQCIVKSQKVTGGGKMLLMLDCTAAAQPELPTVVSAANTPGATTAGGRPTPGAPGVVTVIPTPVG